MNVGELSRECPSNKPRDDMSVIRTDQSNPLVRVLSSTSSPRDV